MSYEQPAKGVRERERDRETDRHRETETEPEKRDRERQRQRMSVNIFSTGNKDSFLSYLRSHYISDS